MLIFIAANDTDAEPIAHLHALSWQQHYREAFGAHFLDHEVVQDRLEGALCTSEAESIYSNC